MLVVVAGTLGFSTELSTFCEVRLIPLAVWSSSTAPAAL